MKFVIFKTLFYLTNRQKSARMRGKAVIDFISVHGYQKLLTILGRILQRMAEKVN